MAAERKQTDDAPKGAEAPAGAVVGQTTPQPPPAPLAPPPAAAVAYVVAPGQSISRADKNGLLLEGSPVCAADIAKHPEIADYFAELIARGTIIVAGSVVQPAPEPPAE